MASLRVRVERKARNLASRSMQPLKARIDRLEDTQYRLAREALHQRSLLTRLSGKPIRVLFLCHVGSVWGKVGPLFDELRADPRFDVDVIGLPYRHSTFGDDAYHHDGVIEFLRKQGIEPIIAYDESCDHWLDLQSLEPDYIFYPTPYDQQYPENYHTSVTKYFARLCYIPYYGTEIMRGDVLTITHPKSFYANLTFAFVSHDEERLLVLRTHGGAPGHIDVPVTGAPMLDPIFVSEQRSPDVWNFPDDSTRTRILWTPRWRVEEGTCHFPDYSDHILGFARNHPEVDFVFRPHPMFFDNFVTQERMTEAQKADLFDQYEKTANAKIDESKSYLETFLTSDILISDISSMMIEYLATGKPIIYTHRTNRFNDFGNQLAAGFYWVNNEDELDQVIQQLVAGKDPLRETREAIVADLLRPATGTVSAQIKELLATGF